jgi:hypothetical protein
VPVLSVLEKLRIDSANSAVLNADLDEKKRKRASSIDILIESSLYLSMTSRDSLSSGDEAEAEINVERSQYDPVKKEAQGTYGDGPLYATSANYQNHAPFSISIPSFSARSHSPTASDESLTVTSTESRSLNISDSDADSSVFDDTLCVMATAAIAAQRALSETYSQPYTNEDSVAHPALSGATGYTEALEPLPRTRRSNRPRASTFSVSSSNSNSNSQSLFDTEAERTPLGMITWLASLADDDFVAAKMLAEFGNKKINSSDSLSEVKTDSIPKYQGTRSKDPMYSLPVRDHRRGGESMEPPTQRRRRANSVIEVNRSAVFPVPLTS